MFLFWESDIFIWDPIIITKYIQLQLGCIKHLLSAV